MSTFAGIPLEQKIWLIRSLLNERVRSSFFTRMLGKVDSMTDFQVIGTPEGTIVATVDTYHTMRNAGVPDQEIFVSIEAHRGAVVPGKMPRKVDLAKYIKYRVRLEHRTGKQLTDDQIAQAIAITEEFIRKFSQPKNSTENVDLPPAGDPTSLIFMSELPDSKASKPLVKFNINSGQATAWYYEYPKTIGEVTTGMPTFFRYPQVAVISNDERPLVIVRIEESSFGDPMLCAVRADGSRANFGPFATTTRDAFMKKVHEVILQLK